jgi:hypothetical protein
MRRLLLLAAVALPLAFAAPAAAVEPTRETVTLHRVINPAVSCPGFAVIGTFDITREITTFYDDNGTPVKRIIYAEITGTYTNAVTGYTLPTASHEVRIFHYDLTTGEFFSTGSNTLIFVPGGGMVTLGTGRLVFDAQGRLLEHSGPDIPAEIAQLCAALAG